MQPHLNYIGCRKMNNLNYITGDLLKSNESVIVHGVNARGVMNSGIAKAIRNRYPGNYDTYRQEYEKYVKDSKVNHIPLGTIIPFFASDNRLIINAVTQKDFGKDNKQYISYDAIATSMNSINEFIEYVNNDNLDKTMLPNFWQKNKINSIGMPLIGAGLGGGDWPTIEDIISSKITETEVNIYTLDNKVPGKN